MASKKNIEEVREDEETNDQLEEVREEQAGIDLPGEESQDSGVSADEVVEAAEADGVEVDESQMTAEEKKVAKAGKRSAKAVREAEEEAARQEAKDEPQDDEPKVRRRSEPNPLKAHGKKYREAAKLVDASTYYSFEEGLELVAKTATTKFDSSVELHVNLGVDPRQADQMVRATVVLPHGTGKTLRIAVFADGKAAEDAKAAGADIVGTDELLKDIEAGKLNFDMLIATPDKMAGLGKVARVLGPRGLMPNPKSGSVTPDVKKAVTEAKGGKVEFRIDKQAIVHQVVGKVSFKNDQLAENVTTLLSAILRAKPSASKGTYVKAISFSSSMGPGIKIDAQKTIAAISGTK